MSERTNERTNERKKERASERTKEPTNERPNEHERHVLFSNKETKLMFQIRQCLDTRQPGTDVSILGDPGADSRGARESWNRQKKKKWAKKSDGLF